MWTYKGVDIYRAGPNSTGLRWEARITDNPDFPDTAPPRLLADTKQTMRELINHYRRR